MELFDTKFGKLRRPEFDKVPERNKYTLFGVDYARLVGKQGGEMYLTRYGWGSIDQVMPGSWFVGDKFKKVGRALAGATGAVYRTPVEHPANDRFALVVKFSRAAQDISVTLLGRSDHLDEIEMDKIEQAQFLSPFEEFGNLCALRAESGIATKYPLAIYSPPTRYLDWQLGRKSHLCSRMDRALAATQADVPENRRVKYDWERLYILLYRWIDGIDAEAAMQAGMIGKDLMMDLGEDARKRMREHGWIVCDHKPRHVIIRSGPNGAGLLRRQSKVQWALIDYELLVRV